MAACRMPTLVSQPPTQRVAPACRGLVAKRNSRESKATFAPISSIKSSNHQPADPAAEHSQYFPRAGSAERRRSSRRSRSVSTSFSVISGDTRQTVSALTLSFEEQFVIRDPPSSSWVFDDLDESEFDTSHVSVPEDAVVSAIRGGGGLDALGASPQSSTRGVGASRACVDISAWLDSRAHIDDKQMVVLRVLKAAMNHGSFDIVGHGVPQHVLDNLVALANQFFDQPFDAKSRLQAFESDLGFRTERSSIKGAYGTGAQHFSAITPLDDPANVRDGLNETFLMVLEEYSRQMETLEDALLKLFAEALSLAEGVRLPKDSLVKAKAGAGGLIRCTHREPSAAAAPQGSIDVCSVMSILYSHREAPESAESVAAFASASAADAAPALRVTLGDMMNVWSGGLFVNGSFPCGTMHDAINGHNIIEHRTAEAGNRSGSILGGALPGFDEA